MDSLGIHAPDGIEPLTACRGWTIDPRGPTLRSLVQGTSWAPGRPLEARCLSELGLQHARAPVFECGCGVWGLADPLRLWGPAGHPTAVLGTVRLWGRVVAGTAGWRAEFALPAALVRPPADTNLRDPWWRVLHPGIGSLGDVIEAVADRYDLPVLDSWPALSLPSRLQRAA